MSRWIVKSTKTAAVALALAGLVAGAAWYFLPARQADLNQIAKLLDAGEEGVAVLELKSVLQQRPEDGQARLLLGRALLLGGEAEAADAEFSRALAGGVSIDDVAAAQSSALLALGKGKELIAKFANVIPVQLDEAAELQTNLAQAYAKGGDVDKSESALAAAFKLVPNFAPAVLLKARWAAASGDRSAAAKLVEGVLAKSPRNAKAWALKGDLLRTQPNGNVPAAEAYRKALEIQPRQLGAQVELLNLLIGSGDTAVARAQVQQLIKLFPGNGTVLYYDALLALVAGDVEHAREGAQRLVKAGATSAPVFLLAGQVEAKLGFIGQAEAHFSKAMALAPEAPEPRRKLAAALLQQGQWQRALEVLRPLLVPASNDPVALAQGARAYLALGDFVRADVTFKRAGALAPDDVNLKTARAQASLGMGQADLGLRELEAIASTDKGTAADLALISARLSRKEFDQALRAVDALGVKQPQSPVVDEIRGQIALMRQDRAGARQHFEAALKKDAKHTATVQRLALLDLADNKPAEARKRFETLLQSDPQDVTALVSLAELLRRNSTDTKELTELLDKAVQAGPANPRVRLAVVDQLARAGLRDAALTAAQAAVATLPNDPLLLEHLALLQLAAGDQNQALSNLKKLTSLHPKSASAQLKFAEVLRSQGAQADADEHVRTAMRLDPESTPVQVAAVGLALRQGQPGKALELAQALQKRLPDEALGFAAAGDVEAGRGRWSEAVDAYGQALKKHNPGLAPMGYHLSLLKAKREKNASAFEQSWLKANPKDTEYMMFLASLANRADESDRAEAHLRRVIDVAPRHVVAINNLANLLLSQHKPGARELAERAVALAPAVGEMQDTLATVLAAANQLDKAVEVQLAAVKLSPSNGVIRLNLAKLYLRSGDKDKARGELNRVAKLGAAFAGQAEVAGLLKDLGPAPGGRSIDTPAPSGLRAPAAPAAADVGPLELAALGALAIGAATAGVLLMAALRPPSFKLERSVVIAAPGWQVFEALQDFRLWQAWSPWPQFGPGPTRQFTGATAGLHHRCRWSTDDRRMSGSVEIMQMLAPTKVLIEWNEERPALVHRLHELSLLATEAGSTMVQWSASGQAPFGSRLKGLLLNRDGRLAQQLAEALDALKQGVESGRLTGAARIDAHAAAAPVA